MWAWPVAGVSGSGRLEKTGTCQASVAVRSLALAGVADLAELLHVAEVVLRACHPVAKAEKKIHGESAGSIVVLVIELGRGVERLRRRGGDAMTARAKANERMQSRGHLGPTHLEHLECGRQVLFHAGLTPPRRQSDKCRIRT